MKHPLKKGLAALTALLLLCGALPMAATAAEPGANLLQNGDFETGSKNPWSCNSGTATVVTNAHDGAYALQLTNPGQWGEAAIQTVSVKSNTVYSITWWSKRVSGSGAFNVYVMDGTNFSNMTSQSGQNWMNETSGNWVRNEYVVNSGSATRMLLKFSSETTNAGSIIIDDVSIVEVIEPNSDGYVVNGDFETGTASPWTTYNPTAITADAAYEGYRGARLKGDGGWGTMMCQTLKGFTVGETYELRFWIKVNAAGVNLQIKSLNNSGAVLAEGYYDTAKCGGWTPIALRFTAVANTVFLNFCGSGTGTAEDAYVDSVGCTHVIPSLVNGGGLSVRDDDNGARGLAFKFDVTAANGRIGIRNDYQSGSATVTVNGETYPLLRMGAVMTNSAAVGNGDMTLTDVDGKRVIHVPAVYLCGCEARSLSFAVRILDIPDRHTATDIFARPYYVYDKNGTEVTVYGDTLAGNYDGTLNG